MTNSFQLSPSKKKSSEFEGSTLMSAPIMMQKAKGVYLWDNRGKKYLDLFSQTWSVPLGHNNLKVIAAAKKQLTKISHLRTAYLTEEKLKLTKILLSQAPAGLAKINYCLHGSLAVEGAMKLAINRYKDRSKILYLEDGFHGRSLATMGISWKDDSNKYNDYFANGIEVTKDIKSIEQAMLEHKPAAIILELVQGNTGFQIVDKTLVQGIRKLCDQLKVTMIVDEIQTAFGCVKNTFLSTDYDITPDILVFGKAIGGGFPLAGHLAKSEYSFEAGQHSFTFGHNPISFAAATAFVEEIDQYRHRVTPLSHCIITCLQELENEFSFLSGARAIGTKGAIDITGFEHNVNCKLANQIVDKMQSRGIIMSCSRYRGLGHTLMLQAPLITEVSEIYTAFLNLREVLVEIACEYAPVCPAETQNEELLETQILAGTGRYIGEHSRRHCKLALRLGRSLGLEHEELSILRVASLAHDIGGYLKEKIPNVQKAILQMEFSNPDKVSHKSKPSFHPEICLAHARERVATGARAPLTSEDTPFKLYLEEFQLLKGSTLTLEETKLLEVWWNHPRYSVALLKNRGVSLRPETETLILCNEQPWLYHTCEHTKQLKEKFTLPQKRVRLLLAIMRAADILENGNNKLRRDMRGVALEGLDETLNFISYKFLIDKLMDSQQVIKALGKLMSQQDPDLFSVLFEAREGEVYNAPNISSEKQDGFSESKTQQTVSVPIDVVAGSLGQHISREFDNLLSNNPGIQNYTYDSRGELQEQSNGIFFKFSFIESRNGEFDKKLILEEALPQKVHPFEEPHLDPKGRVCPFCQTKESEVLARIILPSSNSYNILLNIDPYGVCHSIMSSSDTLPQTLDEVKLYDLMITTQAFGPLFEGSFTSFSGASIKHYHGQFYKVKTPVWKNIFENRLEYSVLEKNNEVDCLEITNWPARTFLLKSKNALSLSRQVWRYVCNLMENDIPYNSKFLYAEDGTFYFLLSPRIHGFMSHIENFLADADQQPSPFVCGCGSVEAPGGDAIMFTQKPAVLLPEQTARMCLRFADTLRDTSEWNWMPPIIQKEHSSALSTDGHVCANPDNSRIAHRIESLDHARRAVNLKFSRFEVDVQLTKDHQLVAFWGLAKCKERGNIVCFDLKYSELTAISHSVMKLEELCNIIEPNTILHLDIKDWADTNPNYRDALANALLHLIEKIQAPKTSGPRKL